MISLMKTTNTVATILPLPPDSTKWAVTLYNTDPWLIERVSCLKHMAISWVGVVYTWYELFWTGDSSTHDWHDHIWTWVGHAIHHVTFLYKGFCNICRSSDSGVTMKFFLELILVTAFLTSTSSLVTAQQQEEEEVDITGCLAPTSGRATFTVVGQQGVKGDPGPEAHMDRGEWGEKGDDKVHQECLYSEPDWSPVQTDTGWAAERLCELPPTSCKVLYQCNPVFPSGYYNITTPHGVKRVYCVMNTSNCDNITGG